MSNDEDDIEKFLEEFCVTANDEEEENDEELQAKFENMYQNFINVDIINKNSKMMV